MSFVLGPDVVCPEGQEYKPCGPSNPKTCLNVNVNVTTVDLNVCADGCFCPEGLLQEGDKCVKPEECGCFYNNEYMAVSGVSFFFCGYNVVMRKKYQSRPT